MLHRRDFIFNDGFYNDSDGSPGSGTNRFVISASNNALPFLAIDNSELVGCLPPAELPAETPWSLGLMGLVLLAALAGVGNAARRRSSAV